MIAYTWHCEDVGVKFHALLTSTLISRVRLKALTTSHRTEPYRRLRRPSEPGCTHW
jgi:hypothetical protein